MMDHSGCPGPPGPDMPDLTALRLHLLMKDSDNTSCQLMDTEMASTKSPLPWKMLV